ncbi:MAG: phosphoglycerate dehydrogenase [Actinomycetia bacterium]|nr:phosphoglycerate dehydrogenase [Actinomycetes bacterium]
MNILTTTSSFCINEFPKEINVIHNPFKRRLTEDEVLDLIEKYQPIGMIAGIEPLTRKVLEKARNLKIISRCGIGVDSLDMEAAKELDIKVTITPDAPMVSVAELTLGLILGLLRRINTLDAGMRRGGWKGPKGNLLSDKIVGIIGCGRIGTYVARLAVAFGCKIMGYDPFVKDHDICSIGDLGKLLKESDIVTLHVPYSRDNHHLIAGKELNTMKSNAILINAARGGLVDEVALCDALRDGVIAGAAMDCFEMEPYSGPLTGLENTLLTPHMGSSASEARVMMEKQALDNLVDELKRLNIL